MKTAGNALSQEVVDSFIINTILISPVAKIVRQLEKGEFRDCDIKWLDTKLETYTKIAAETLFINGFMPSDVASERHTMINEYVKNQYINRFNTLLQYFKTYSN